MPDTERTTQTVIVPAESTTVNTNNRPAAANGTGSAPTPSESPQETNGETKKAPRYLGPVLGAAALILLLVFGIPLYNYNRTHQGTDDAYVTGNLVNISPIISGTVSYLNVEEGDTVKKGALIARLENSSELSALRQAQAAFDAASSQVPEAQTSLSLEQQQTDAAIESAQASLTAQQAKTAGAGAQLQQTRGTSSSGVVQARAQFETAVATAAQAAAQRDSAIAAVNTQKQAVSAAMHAANAAESAITSAKANAVKADNDANRYARLVAEDAVTQQQYDSAVAAAATANAQAASAQDQYEQAAAQVSQAQSAATQAQETAQAAAQAANAAGSQVAAAHANVLTAIANLNQIGVQQGNLLNNSALVQQAQANLSTAVAGKQQVDLKRQQIYTAKAQAMQAHAELVNAQVQESDTYLYAPTVGEVVHKAVNVGAAVTPGQTLVTITQAGQVWVTANFKETQLQNVKSGENAEVKVDAYPGITFEGKVDSINEATGSSTALLPPDNATGNFTKVVQRIPVKIVLIPDTNKDGKYATADDILSLRQGESVTATIDTSSK